MADLIQLKQREQELIDNLHHYEQEAKAMFNALRENMAVRELSFEELTAVQSVFNEELIRGEQRILDDIRAGKVGLVNAESGAPLTVALFQKR